MSSKEIKTVTSAKRLHEEFNDWLEKMQESCPVDWRWLDGESPDWVDYRFYDKVRHIDEDNEEDKE